MKKITIIGASGFIGSAILKESLKRGHTVTAIVRHPERITLEDPNLKILKGDVLVEKYVPELVKGADVVISAYNPGWTNPEISGDTTKAYKSIIDGVKKAKIPRLLIVGVIISVKVSHHFGKVSHLQKLGGFVGKYTNLFDIFLSQRFSLEFKAMS